MIRILHDISEIFVSNIYPERGERVTLSLFSSEKDVSVFLKHRNFQGLESTEEMALKGSSKYPYVFDISVSLNPADEIFDYYFVIKKDESVFYYSRKGLEKYIPSFSFRFQIKSGVNHPEWVSSRCCYQIFPDRFFNSGKSKARKEGEYYYNGAYVSTYSFSDVPPEYSKARSLDFFNGDLYGVAEKLSYIKEAGFDMLYINPVFSSPTSHRYDSSSFFSVDEALGGDDALIFLIEKAHSMDIAVILDISINHTSKINSWFKKANEDPSSAESGFYYSIDGKYKFWAGIDTMPELNYESEELKNLIYRNPDSVLKRYIKKPFSADGWRFDVAAELGRGSRDQITLPLWKEIHDELRKEKSDLYTVSEIWDDASSYINSGIFDGTMNYFYAGRAIRAFMGEEDRDLQKDWGHNPKKVDKLDAYGFASLVNDSLFSLRSQNWYFQMNIIDSHDTPRLTSNEKVMDDDLYLSLVAFIYFLPGFPSIYYGDEIKLDGKMGSPEMARYPMQWDERKWNKKYRDFHIALKKIRERKGFAFSSFSIKALNDHAFIARRILPDEIIFLILCRDKDESIILDDWLIEGKNAQILFGEAEVKESTIKVMKNKVAVISYPLCSDKKC